MSNLRGKTVLIFGGSGEVGEGITRQFLQAGANVIVPSRSAEKLTTLREHLGEMSANLQTIAADTSTEAGMLNLRDQIGRVDHIVASLGGWWQGQPITAIHLELWQQLIDNSLTAHFLAAKTFLPQLADRASYTLINGGAALYPMPMVSPIAVSASAQLKLGEQMAVENQHLRINSLVLATPILTRSRPEGQPGWLSADDAGRYCIYLTTDANKSHGETIVFKNISQLPKEI